VRYEILWSPEEDLRWKVSPQFPAETALNGNGLKGKLLYAGWNVAAASLAFHHEGLPNSEHLEHASMIGNK
jgi:hypothetical protein